MSKKQYARIQAANPLNGQRVRILAQAENWAMVRNEYQHTFCLMLKELVFEPSPPISEKGEKK